MAIAVKEVESCRICWTDIPEGCQTKMTLGCGHTFDAHCIMGWLNTSETKHCPQCLKVVVDKGSLWVPRSWFSTLRLSRCLLCLFVFLTVSSFFGLLVGGEILRSLPAEEVWIGEWLDYVLRTYAEPVFAFCFDFIFITLVYIFTFVKGGPLLPEGLRQLIIDNAVRYDTVHTECSSVMLIQYVIGCVPDAKYYCAEIILYRYLREIVLTIVFTLTFMHVIVH